GRILYRQFTSGSLVDQRRNAVAVKRTGDEGAKDEQVERALDEGHALPLDGVGSAGVPLGSRTPALQSQQILLAGRGRYASVLLDRDCHANWLRQVERRFEHSFDTALWIGLEKTRADWCGLLAQHPELIGLAGGGRWEIRCRGQEP